MNLYKEIKIWRHVNETTAVCFICLENITERLFAVQSANFFHMPITLEQVQFFEKQYLELFIEIPPIERCDWFESLEKAIEEHDRDFSNQS